MFCPSLFLCAPPGVADGRLGTLPGVPERAFWRLWAPSRSLGCLWGAPERYRVAPKMLQRCPDDAPGRHEASTEGLGIDFALILVFQRRMNDWRRAARSSRSGCAPKTYDNMPSSLRLCPSLTSRLCLAASCMPVAVAVAVAVVVGVVAVVVVVVVVVVFCVIVLLNFYGAQHYPRHCRQRYWPGVAIVCGRGHG